MSTILCRIVTPNGTYREMDTDIITIDTIDGQEGILPNHMPLVTMLEIGSLKTIEDGKTQIYAIAGGMFYFRDNKADILTDSIENQKDIDVDRAERAKGRAQKRLESNDPDIDQKRAEIALKKAINRLHVRDMQ